MSDQPRLSVAVDRGLCIGSGICVGTAPDRFALDDEQRSHPVAEQTDFDAAIVDAAASCPVEAISVRDADTGEPVPLD
jgi:ferredoxin